MDWVERLFETPELLRMGHNQRAEDRNLGLGWLYYALGRIVRPARAVVIGSWRGFVPILLGRALADNAEGGEVIFLDPSYVDDFWADPAAVAAHFASHGAGNVRHFRMTTQEFVESPAYRDLGDVGLVFIDGHHTREQAEFDYRAFAGRLAPRGFALFHDSMVIRRSGIYGPDNAYEVRVRDYIDELRGDASLQVLDVPFGSGLTLVRRRDPEGDEPLLLGSEERVKR